MRKMKIVRNAVIAGGIVIGVSMASLMHVYADEEFDIQPGYEEIQCQECLEKPEIENGDKNIIPDNSVDKMDDKESEGTGAEGVVVYQEQEDVVSDNEIVKSEQEGLNKESEVNSYMPAAPESNNKADSLSGWIKVDGKHFYYRNGVAYKGWHFMTGAEGEKKNHWSYFGNDGVLRTGWQQLGKGTKNPDGDNVKHWSYFGENGWLREGWQQLGKGTKNPDGNNAKHWSYFGENGWLREGWQQLGKGTKNPDGNNAKHWSYFGENGWLREGWQQLGKGTKNPDGNNAKHWSYFGENGWLREGWQQLGKGTKNPDGNNAKHWSYFGENGWLREGWQQLGKGTKNPDGNNAKHWSYFGENGWLREGWQQLGKGTKNPDGNNAKHWSYFGENGWLRTGWQNMGRGTNNPDGNAKQHKSYFGGNGWLRTGLQYIDGVAYIFDDYGWLVEQDYEMLNKAQSYSSSTGYMILVNRGKCKTAVFTGKEGNWKMEKYWPCCVGAQSTPTITGTYRLGSKGMYFNTGSEGRCWYYSQISGSYLFHSVIYYREASPYTIYDGTMGKWVSHGCVRLDVQNAKWIYDIVPSGTTIVIYN